MLPGTPNANWPLAMTRVRVHVHPANSREHVGGDHDGALRVRVRARAINGAATDRVLELMADAFGVHRRQVQLVRSTTSRDKLIAIEGDPEALSARLSILRQER